MRRWICRAVVLCIVGAVVAGFFRVGDSPAQDRGRSGRGWTLDEALKQLAGDPHDAYMQYVVLQLAKREGRLDEIGDQVERMAFGGGFNRFDPDGRAGRVDLFNIFTGALAVQESLQLDAMRGGAGRRPRDRFDGRFAEEKAPPRRAGKVVLVDVASRKVRSTIPDVGGARHTLAVSSDGRTIASSTNGHPNVDGTMPGPVVVDAVTGKLRTEFRRDWRTINAVAFLPDGKTLAVLGHPQEGNRRGMIVRLYDVEKGTAKATLDAEGNFQGMAVSPDGRFVALAGHRFDDEKSGRPEPKALVVLDAATGRVTASAQSDEQAVSVVFSPDGKTLAGGFNDGSIRLFDAADGRDRGALIGGAKFQPITSLALSPSLLASAGQGEARLWNVRERQLIGRLVSPGHNIREDEEANQFGWPGSAAVAFSPDGTTIAVSSGSTVRFYDPTAIKTPVATIELGRGNAGALVFTPDGKTLFVGVSVPVEGPARRFDDGEVKDGPPRFKDKDARPPDLFEDAPPRDGRLKDGPPRKDGVRKDDFGSKDKAAVRDDDLPIGPIPVGSLEYVDVSRIAGPTIKSHPWQEMLAGKKPEICPLAKLVPEDFYFVQFRSLTKLLDVVDAGDLWATHFFTQTGAAARSHDIGERLKRRLAIKTDPLTRPFYDLVVEDVAIVGSDPFVFEGSDVTMIFRLKNEGVFRARMDGYLADFAKQRADSVRSEGEYRGVKFVKLATADRDLSAFSAYPAAGLHVRSTSQVALQRIIDAIQGNDAAGKAVRTLGGSTEFAYVRTLFVRGAAEEDGLLYLSDPFIRRLVGPVVKLTERRRMVCYNHLKMIGHAGMLYRTEQGRTADSLEALTKAGCTPGVFGAGRFACPDGGKYALTADGLTGSCSHHCRPHCLTPCCEIPVAKVTGEEAQEYNEFLAGYNQFWRTFFDPIAIRIRAVPQQFRVETVVLPLIDNSIYTGLSQVLGGKPEPLDALPVPKRNIFSVGLRFNKDVLLEQLGPVERELMRDLFRDLRRADRRVPDLGLAEFLARGIGNQVALNVYDSAQTFDFNLASFLGQAMGTFQGRGPFGGGSEVLMISLLVGALNSPIYVSVPVQDAAVVDRFLEKLDGALTMLAGRVDGADFFRIEQDFYKGVLAGGSAVRGYGFSVGPLKWRFFWARIGKGFYVASKKEILDDLAAAGAQNKDAGPAAHAALRVRAENWNQVLPDYRISWAEGNRKACHKNLAPLSAVARAAGPDEPADKTAIEAHRLAGMLHGVRFACPDGGTYVFSGDGKSCSCSVHGDRGSPKQPFAPSAATDPSAKLRSATASIVFLEDGLRAVLTIAWK